MIFKSPANIAKRLFLKPTVFLAGSIEMNSCIDWQEDLGQWFDGKGFNVFNPRRADWDSTWIQTYDNPNFSQQVQWEINALKQSDLIIMNFIPDTISPISLLEVGLFASSGKMHIICPEGYFRKGNVEVVCSLYNIPLYDTIEKLKEHI